jgi:hypothetical protein
MDEYNINWDWKQEDKRMNDWRSAVWDAAFCVSAINAGADGTAAWNECDGAYGKTTRDHVRRPAADSFHLINSLLPGTSVPAEIDAPESSGVRVLAILRPDERKALLLLNIGTRPRTLTGVTGKATMIQKEGMTTHTLENEISLPPLSLAVIKVDCPPSCEGDD